MRTQSVCGFSGWALVAFCLSYRNVVRCVCSHHNKTLFSFLSLFRCSICLPAPQPGPQWPCSPDAGHPQAPHRTRLPPARPAPPPFGRLDQGWWCASALANEAARCSFGGGHPESRLNHCCYLPLTHDVCRANWGNDYKKCCICSDMFEVS